MSNLSSLGRVIGMTFDGCSADQFVLDVGRIRQTGAVLLVLGRSLIRAARLVLNNSHATGLNWKGQGLRIVN